MFSRSLEWNFLSKFWGLGKPSYSEMVNGDLTKKGGRNPPQDE